MGDRCGGPPLEEEDSCRAVGDQVVTHAWGNDLAGCCPPGNLHLQLGNGRWREVCWIQLFLIDEEVCNAQRLSFSFSSMGGCHRRKF